MTDDHGLRNLLSLVKAGNVDKDIIDPTDFDGPIKYITHELDTSPAQREKLLESMLKARNAVTRREQLARMLRVLRRFDVGLPTTEYDVRAAYEYIGSGADDMPGPKGTEVRRIVEKARKAYPPVFA